MHLFIVQQTSDATDMSLDPKQHFDLWHTRGISATDWLKPNTGKDYYLLIRNVSLFEAVFLIAQSEFIGIKTMIIMHWVFFPASDSGKFSLKPVKPATEKLRIEAKHMQIIFEVVNADYHVPRLCLKVAANADVADWSAQVFPYILNHSFHVPSV